MALKVIRKAEISAVEVISRHDDSLSPQCFEGEEDKTPWDLYAKTGDVSKLLFVDDKQPTVFLCNFDIKGKDSQAIKNNMIGGKDDDGNPKIALGSWSFRVAKAVLKEIKNPEYVPLGDRLTLKRDKDGLVHDDLIGDLESMGVVDAIFNLYTQLVLNATKANVKN
jgi:hypothetical protein